MTGRDGADVSNLNRQMAALKFESGKWLLVGLASESGAIPC